MGKIILTNEAMYDIAHVHVRHWELDKDGLTNYSTDSGGPTRNGISLAYLKTLGIDLGDLNKDGKIDIDDVRMVDFDTAKRLFRQTFWDNAKANLLPPMTAAVFYDFSVTSGAGRAAIEMQKAIDTIYPGTIVSYAANIGPKTQKACQRIMDDDKDFALAKAFQKTRQAFYQYLSTTNPAKYGPFINGWTARVNALTAMLNEIASTGITDAVYTKARNGYGF